MLFKRKEDPKQDYSWIPLTSEIELEELKKISNTKAIIIFKHSTRCSISHMANSRLQADAEEIKNTPFYYLDLLNYRTISNQIAAEFNVTHESPQVLVIKNEKCVYHASHNAIEIETLKQEL